MNRASPPKRKTPARGESGAGHLKTSTLEPSSISARLSTWREHGQRLLSEWTRTGDARHLRAFRVHRGATGAVARWRKEVA